MKLKDIAAKPHDPALFRYQSLVYTKLAEEVTLKNGEKANAVCITSGKLIKLAEDEEVFKW